MQRGSWRGARSTLRCCATTTRASAPRARTSSSRSEPFGFPFVSDSHYQSTLDAVYVYVVVYTYMSMLYTYTLGSHDDTGVGSACANLFFQVCVRERKRERVSVCEREEERESECVRERKRECVFGRDTAVASVQGSPEGRGWWETFVSLNSRLESNKEEEEEGWWATGRRLIGDWSETDRRLVGD